MEDHAPAHSVRKLGGCRASRAKRFYLAIGSSSHGASSHPPMDARSRVTKTTFSHALYDQNSSIGYVRYGSRTHSRYFSHQRGF